MRKISTTALVLALATGPVLGLGADAVAKTETHLEIYGSQAEQGKETVDAALTKGSNQQGISRQKVVFKYFVKDNGDWMPFGKVTDKTSGLGLASGTLNSVARGTCKVTAKFAGTDTLAASKDHWIIDCTTGEQV